jgi:hypothetical protein
MRLAVVLLVASLVFMAVAFVGYALILWDAFKTDLNQGFLCLCVPFYFLYYGLARSHHPRRKLILAVVVGAYCIATPLQYFAQRVEPPGEGSTEAGAEEPADSAS